MNNTLRGCLSLGLLMTGLLTASQRASADPAKAELKITVTVYNFADVYEKRLVAAEKIASSVLGKAGITVVWADQHDPADQTVPNLCRIQLDLLSGPMTEDLKPPAYALGLAPGSGPNRQNVFVFYNRVKELGNRLLNDSFGITMGRRIDNSVVLGHAMAHEIGHILGLDLHSASGIMRADWTQNDLLKASYGEFNFTAQQAEVIQASVLNRLRQPAN